MGNVGSSVDTTPTVKKMPQAKKVITATPQKESTKKQVTKKIVDSSQSELEVDTEQNTSKGSKMVSEEYKSKETEDDMFYVETLLEKRGSKYLVKWENYPESYNSWEPRFGLPEEIVKVESSHIVMINILSIILLVL